MVDWIWDFLFLLGENWKLEEKGILDLGFEFWRVFELEDLGFGFGFWIWVRLMSWQCLDWRNWVLIREGI